MGDQRDGGISWTDETWNPVRGCSKVSSGCANCYAETMAARFSKPGQPYHGLAQMTDKGPRWTGRVELVHKHLTDPIGWRRPRRIFVNSMSDLFHESLKDEDIDQVFGVMAACQFIGRGDDAYRGHTFQVLTKRAERMAAYMKQDRREQWARCAARLGGGEDSDGMFDQVAHHEGSFPHIWLGVSVEDQRNADERIPHLLETPAAVRFLSVEPQVGPVEVGRYFWLTGPSGAGPLVDALGRRRGGGGVGGQTLSRVPSGDIHWVIQGGESGPGARTFKAEWALSLAAQCKEAGVAYFLKQLGACFVDEKNYVAGRSLVYDAQVVPNVRRLTDKAGGDMAEWPSALQRLGRAFPEVER